MEVNENDLRLTLLDKGPDPVGIAAFIPIPFPPTINRSFRPYESCALSSNQGQNWKMKAVPAFMAHEEQPFGR